MSQRTTDAETDPETRTERTDRYDYGPMKWMSAIASLVGLWIAASPFVYEAITDTALWNNVIVGAAVFLLAGYNYYRMSNGHRVSIGTSSLVALLGLWALLAPFLFAFGSEALELSTIVSGLVIAVLAGYNVYRGRRIRAETTTRTRA